MRFRSIAFVVAGMMPFLACSSSSDGGEDAGSDSVASHPPGSGGGDGGGSSSDTGGPGIVADTAPIPGPCETYADKAYGCCSSSATCAGTTRETFLAYCTQFYPGCTKYYNCYLGASTCAAAEACPTAGAGGCS